MKSGVVVCDASPLIFLAKLDRLDLVSSILISVDEDLDRGRDLEDCGHALGRIVVLRCVADELMARESGSGGRSTAGSSPEELLRLDRFLHKAKIIDFDLTASAGEGEVTPAQEFFSKALSLSDLNTLHWAIEHREDIAWLLADERLLRRIAREQGIPVVGFLGLLVTAARRGVMTTAEAREAVNNAVSMHRCRLSVALYQRVMAELASSES